MSLTAYRASCICLGWARNREGDGELCEADDSSKRPLRLGTALQGRWCCLCFCCNTTVHENLDLTIFALASMAIATPGSPPDLLSLVASLDAALLPCLPARELQAADRSTHPSDQVDVERHVADFMEAAKSLQSYFIRIQHQHQPTREEALRKEIAGLEAELKEKDALLEKQNKLLQRWQDLLEAQKNIHIQELERV